MHGAHAQAQVVQHRDVAVAHIYIIRPAARRGRRPGAPGGGEGLGRGGAGAGAGLGGVVRVDGRYVRGGTPPAGGGAPRPLLRLGGRGRGQGPGVGGVDARLPVVGLDAHLGREVRERGE
jgi:hypothetical protein